MNDDKDVTKNDDNTEEWVLEYPFLVNKKTGEVLERVPWGFCE